MRPHTSNVRRGVDAAKDLLQLRGEELVGGVGRPDEEQAARPEGVVGLLDDELVELNETEKLDADDVPELAMLEVWSLPPDGLFMLT